MVRSLEQPDVRIVANNDVKIAISADLLKEPHVAGVKPIIGTGDDNLFSNFCRSRAGTGRRGSRVGKALQSFVAENAILQVMPLAERLPFRVVLALDISPHRRAET